MFKIFIIILYFRLVRSDYNVGVGIADCTGPPTQIPLIPSPWTEDCGIHLRQFARAFIVDDGLNRIVFVSTDTLAISQAVREKVTNNLNKKFGDLYSEKNLILSGTHTHSGPGGFLKDFFYDVLSKGFAQETFDYLVDGITQAVIKAHISIVPGKIFLKSGVLLGANENRRLAAYKKNLESERSKYDYDTDKELVQLTFVRSSDNKTLGVFNWYPVHPTSMFTQTCLISSDNVGYASVLLEKYLNKNLPGKGPIVAAFASSNLGDVAPTSVNISCTESKEICDRYAAFHNTKFVAEQLFEKAKELLHQEEAIEVTGAVKHIHQYVDMPKQKTTVVLPNGTKQEVHGCLPAIALDVPLNSFLAIVSRILNPREDVECQYPKTIMINSGRFTLPYQWQPQIVPTMIGVIGSVVLLAVPGEFTTMAGRRLRNAVHQIIDQNKEIKFIVTGLSNTYSSYITTFEEYKAQEFEGGFTLYGPHTLDIYINQYRKLGAAIINNSTVDPGPTPPTFPSHLISLNPPDTFDSSRLFRNFGDCIQEPPFKVARGDTVAVKFISGNPRHNPLHGDSFLSVDRFDNGTWVSVFSDADWDTKFFWQRTNFVTSTSQVTVEWDVFKNATVGKYRIRHKGHYKTLFGDIVPYQGETNSFTVE